MFSKKQKKVVNIGVVGAGFVSQLAHIANYALLDNCRVVALAELKPRLRKLVAQRYGIVRTYPSHKELLDDQEVEAVVVVTQRPMIGPVALDCLNKGKHLITEKPMAATLRQAQILVKAALKQKVCYAVGYMKRYDEGIQQAKKIIDELLKTGELGPIIYVRAHCFMGDPYCNIDGNIVTGEKIHKDIPTWPIAPSWIRENQESEYAWFLNVYCHNINLLRFLLGSTPSVDYVRFDRKDARVALLDFGEYEAVLEAGSFTYHSWDEVTEIYFARGYLKIETPPPFLRNASAQIKLYKGKKEQQIYIPQYRRLWAFRRQAESFIACILEKRQPIASGFDALQDMRLIEEMWRMEYRR
jgi:predicted dehydrogenase